MNEISKVLDSFGMETVGIIRTNLANTGTNASGETSNSLASNMPTENRVVVSGTEFINVVETGRKPGKMPPVSKIRKWLESGKVNFEGTAESTAWGIAKFIAMHGSSLYRKGGRTDIITPAISDERIDALTNDIADASLKLVVTDIEDWIDGVTNDKQ